MVPGTVAYAWLGHAGKQALSGDADAVRYGLLGLGALALIAFAPRLLRHLRFARPVWVEAAALKAQLEAGSPLLLVDVRSPDEFAGEFGHIPSSLNVPVGELESRMAQLASARKDPIVAVCRTDKRSAKAAEMLRAAGFGRVAVLRGGMERWRAEGYAVTGARRSRTASEGVSS
jgi:rhodanese-related sulfurtransferase